MDNRTRGGNALLSAVMGAAVGAGAMLLADKRTRASLKKKLNEWMDEVDEVQDKVENKVKEVRDKGKNLISTEMKKTRAKVDKIQNDLED